MAYYSSGSGIYSSGHAIQYYVSDNLSSATRTGKIVIADVPEDPGSERGSSANDNGKILHPENIKSRTSSYLTYRFLEHSNGVTEVTHSHLEMSSKTCRLEYSIKIHGLLERYALGVFIGVKPNDQSFGYAVCVLVKCRTPNLQDCGTPVDGYSAHSIFNSFHLSGTFANNSDVYAGALGSGLELLHPDTLKVGTSSLTISDYDKPLLSASLWARAYFNDTQQEECSDKVYFMDILMYILVACMKSYFKYLIQNICKQ